MIDPEFRKNATVKEIAELLQNALDEVSRPPNEKVLNDAQLCKYLEVSKRTTATWRASGILAYHKVGGIIFYLLADVLAMLERNRIADIRSKVAIK